MKTRCLIAVCLLAIAACSSHEGGRTSSSTTAAEAPKGAATVASLIAPNARSVARMTGESFFIAQYLTSLMKPPPPCWEKLVSAVTVGYQVEVTKPSYFIVEAPVARDEVEACVTQALGPALGVELQRKGALTKITFPSGKEPIYVVWHAPLIVVGRMQQLETAKGTKDSEAQWQQRLTSLPAGPIAAWRSDALLSRVLGVSTTSYLFALDHLGKGQPLDVAGRVIASYASPADATTAAQHLSAGELVGDAPPALREACKRLKVTAKDATVIMEFDNSTFANLDANALLGWLQSLAG